MKVNRRGRINGGPNPIDTHVGRQIRLRRVESGISQEALAASLGITFQQVQKYERGANRVGASRLYDVSKVLKVPVNFFFDGMADDVAAASPANVSHGAEPEVVEFSPEIHTHALKFLRQFYALSHPNQLAVRGLMSALGKDAPDEQP